VTFGTLILTLGFVCECAQGIFPGCRIRGVIWEYSERRDNISFDAMSQRQQQAGRKVILQDKDVESLSSVSGWMARIQLRTAAAFRFNLKAARRAQRMMLLRIIRRLQRTGGGARKHSLPCSRCRFDGGESGEPHAFQYSIEDARRSELAQWTPKLVVGLQPLRSCEMWPQPAHRRPKDKLTIDRDRRPGWAFFAVR